jgi:hypothetical protein
MDQTYNLRKRAYHTFRGFESPCTRHNNTVKT